MASMAVSASTGVMSSLLSKLLVLLSDQYKQLKGVRRDIEFLSRDLTDMNAALEDLADMEKLDAQTKAWRDKVREMAYDIEDVIDVFMHHHAQQGRDDKGGFLNKAARKIRKLRVRYQLAGKIEDIKARVEEQSQSKDRYKIDKSTSKPTVVEVDPRLPAMFEDARRLVGIDGPREEITKLLMEDGATNSGQLLKAVSLVGFGGLGKTTLANQVYNKIKSEFECTTFLSVSRTPHMPKIFKDILSGVGYRGTDMEDDVQKLIDILRAHLMNKRCHADGTDLEVSYFPGQGHVYHMQPLDENHSRRLFFKRLFDTEDGCLEQFRDISNDMLRKCKGVPLAITSITSLLANRNKNVETWEKIRNSLGYELDSNPTLEWMSHVLSLSYNDLSQELKTCLLYLGNYPEDYAIDKVDLMRKWIAEGFVREKHGLDLEEAAENCLNELINRSMVTPVFTTYSSEMWGCRVHDIMLDLIISKCKDENFITLIDREFIMNRASQVRRISHQFSNIDMALAAERMNPSHVRSYTSLHAANSVPLLTKFELLRVLDMDQGPIVGSQSKCLDLSAINHLCLLRYLKVWGFCLELPKKFGKLEHLITLDMSRTWLYSRNQSSDFTSLSSLRHLQFPEHKGTTITMTNGLSKQCNLRTLFHFQARSNSMECIRDLGELTNLRELSLTYSRPGGAEDNTDTILAASLDKLGNSNLRSLNLIYRGPASAKFWRNCLTRPRHLQQLTLYGLIPKVPTWMGHAHRLSYLNYLELQELQSDDFRVLAQLPCLILLRLKAQTILEKNIIIYQNTFPSLKYFEFYCELSCLTFEPAAMPRLQKLEIGFDGCGQGEMQLQEGSLVGGIERLSCLEEVYIDIEAKCGHGSRIESAWRDAINRHPKSQALRIRVHCTEYDENGNMVY
ncbi:hypothetical protein U9M48_041649 [Paspalum notatum var. saurae]|uniref:Uncharacterized protein n=1 Tax=Paspalum notatum var. saurae TaxID=547442 RepID=A0AAQ3UV09_PASNO